MQTRGLFEPSIDENTKKTETFNIDRLFLVSVFCGVIPLACLGTLNCKSLNVSKKITYLLAGVGGVILAAKLALIYLHFSQAVGISQSMIRLMYRGANVLLFLGYHFTMSARYKQHIFFGGVVKPMWKLVIVYTLIGMVIEGIAVFIIKGQVI